MNKISAFHRDAAAHPQKNSGIAPILLVLFAFLACATPLVTACQLSPQPAYVNQWLSVLLWSSVCVIALGWFTAVSNDMRPMHSGSLRNPLERLRSCGADQPLLAFWFTLLAAIGLSVALSFTPWYIAINAFVVVSLAALLTFAVLRMSERDAGLLWRALLFGLLVAALVNALVALLQVFAPRWHDDLWIAQLQGDRAFGNLRQPNLLALLSLWGIVCAFALFKHTLRWLGVACAIPLFAALWLSGSRAGWLGLLIVVACGIVHYLNARNTSRELGALNTSCEHERSHSSSRKQRTAMGFVIACVAAALVLAVIYGVFNSLDRTVSVSQRVSLWHDVLQIVRSHPWLGVGFGQLNFAWTLTELPTRSPDVFDHAHNLPLQWAAEFGLVTTTLLITLIVIFLVKAMRANASPDRFAMLALIAVTLWQSMVEYPLWYAHFLLPTAVCAALLARTPRRSGHTTASAKSSRRFNHVFACVGGFAIAVGLAWSMQGYLAIGAIYANANLLSNAQAAATNAQRHSLYGYFGDYAKIMLAGDAATLTLFTRAPRAIIDEKLLTAWARSLEREARYDEAAYLVARAREFPADQSFAQLPNITASSESRTPSRFASSPRRAVTLQNFRQ